jgi:pimeloyl-ACP methyl ester carboxylesterase
MTCRNEAMKVNLMRSPLLALLLQVAWVPLLMAETQQDPGPETIALGALRETYTTPASRFIDVDGVEVHYTDEGTGFPVLLLHASYMNLESWRHVAAALVPHYRVIRMDFPAVGLSSTETRSPPDGRWDLIGRNVEVATALIDELGIERLNIVATSSGGSVGFRMAAHQPERVNRLVLINSAGMPRTRQSDPNRDRADIRKWQKMPIKPLEYWEYAIGRNFPSDGPPPDWFVNMAYDINRRAPSADRSQYRFSTGNPREILSRVSAPTLVMWGEANPTVVHLEADVFSYWLTSAPSVVKKYPGLGHYPYVEAPEQVVPDIVAFLAGEMDADLRQTVRAKVPITAR